MGIDNYPEGNEWDTTRKLTADKVVKILAKHGTVVSVEEATIILEFMKKVAYIAVNQYLVSDKR